MKNFLTIALLAVAVIIIGLFSYLKYLTKKSPSVINNGYDQEIKGKMQQMQKK